EDASRGFTVAAPPIADGEPEDKHGDQECGQPGDGEEEEEERIHLARRGRSLLGKKMHLREHDSSLSSSSPRPPRSHAPRGNAVRAAPRPVTDQPECSVSDAPRSGAAVRSHAERGNERSYRDPP